MLTKIAQLLNLLTALKKLVEWIAGQVKSWSAKRRQKKAEKHIQKGKDLVYRIKNAKSDEERRLLAKELGLYNHTRS